MCRSVDAVRRLIVLLVLAALGSVVRAAASDPYRDFHLPAGDAATTLRQFVEQSGEQLLFLVPKVRGVQTNPVEGSFTAREALQRMVANTGLAIVPDEKSGALLINRASPADVSAPSLSAKPPPPTQPDNSQAMTTK
ncbi:MAG: TonB-dependent receptor, partial [Opitutaceae bacterium]